MSDSAQDGGQGPSTPHRQPRIYTARQGFANQDGTDFEIKMCALVFLRAVQSYSSFTMTSNDPEAASFDDIVVSYGSPGNEQNILVQLKTSSKAINFSPSSNKSLEAYFLSLKTLNTEYFKDCTFVFFTNANVDLKHSVTSVHSPAEELLRTSRKHGDVFKVDLNDDICGGFRDDIGAEDFVNRLLIFRNQAGVEYLDELIKQELFKICNGFVPEYQTIQDAFVKKIKATWSDKTAKAALDEHWEGWTELKKKLFGQNTLLKQIKFCEDTLSDLEQKVLDSKSDIILFKCDSAEAQIACSKIYQTFISSETLRVLFTDLSELQSSQNMLFGFWSKYEWDLLVVTDVTNCTEKLGENIAKYKGNPEEQNKRKIVIVCSRDADKLGLSQVDECGTDVIKSTFKQLDENSQHRLRNLKVDFQGKRIALGKIMDDNILEGGILQYVVTSPKIEIGTAPPACNGKYIPRTLSKRIRVKGKRLVADLNEEIVIGIDDPLRAGSVLFFWLMPLPFDMSIAYRRPNGTCGRKYYVLSRRKLYEGISGHKCCARTLPEFPVHFLEEYDRSLYWIHSHGSTDRIQRHLARRARKDEDIEMFIRDAKTRLVKEDDLVRKEFRKVIVADEPGSGKTTLLLEVANKMKELNPHHWVIHIDLNKHSGILREMKQTVENVRQLLIKAANEDSWEFSKGNLRCYIFGSEDICILFKRFPKIGPSYKDTILREMKQAVDVMRENVLRLVIKAADLDDSELGKRLLRYSVFESGDICILFDAFDEIAPSYTDTVLDILKFISSEFKLSKLWIASRYNMREALELELKSCMFRIEPLSDEEQIEFMSMFWEKEKAKELHSAIIKKLPLGMTSSPLHINMICEIFSDLDMSDNFSRISASFDVVKLYEQFIEKKFDIYIKEKSSLNSTSAAIEDIKEKEREEFMERHMLCSLYVLDLRHWANEPLKSSIWDKALKLYRNIMEGKERLGIIDGVVSGSREPHFIHRTFAEFFAAKWLAENWKNNLKMLDGVSTEDEYQFVNKLFCLELDRELPVHLAVLNEDIDALKGLKEEDLNKTDVLGRTPLHIAVMMKGGNALNVVLGLLEHGPDLEIVDVLGHTPLYYADRLRNRDVERILRERGAQ